MAKIGSKLYFVVDGLGSFVFSTRQQARDFRKEGVSREYLGQSIIVETEITPYQQEVIKKAFEMEEANAEQI